jgi:hypothetical protein
MLETLSAWISPGFVRVGWRSNDGPIAMAGDKDLRIFLGARCWNGACRSRRQCRAGTALPSRIGRRFKDVVVHLAVEHLQEFACRLTALSTHIRGEGTFQCGSIGILDCEHHRVGGRPLIALDSELNANFLRSREFRPERDETFFDKAAKLGLSAGVNLAFEKGVTNEHVCPLGLRKIRR